MKESTLSPSAEKDAQQLLEELLAADEEWNAAYHTRDPQRLDALLADQWVGFSPDGAVLFKTQFLERLSKQAPELLIFERQACRVHGHTGITRGSIYLHGKAISHFMRVYSYSDRWLGISVQLIE